MRILLDEMQLPFMIKSGSIPLRQISAEEEYATLLSHCCKLDRNISRD